MVVDFAVHSLDEEDVGIFNPHFHVMCPIHPLDEHGRWATSSGKDKWILDEDAAQIVKRVFDLCIDGKGPEQISRILRKRYHVEIPALTELMIAESTLGRKKRRDLNGHAVLCPNRRTYSSLRRLSLTLRCFYAFQPSFGNKSCSITASSVMPA